MPSNIGFTSSRFSKGFGTKDLVDELTISMIVIGLGFNEKDRQLQSTLTHIGIGSLARILEALRNADTLAKSSALAEATSSSVDALAAKGKATAASRSQFTCVVHGKNVTHDSKDCKVVKSALEGTKKGNAKKEKKANKVEDKSDTDTDSESKNSAHAAKLASPPRCRRIGNCADILWNADLGATVHMTLHREWIHGMEPCKVPI